jgi:hypothetical protein
MNAYIEIGKVCTVVDTSPSYIYLSETSSIDSLFKYGFHQGYFSPHPEVIPELDELM